MCRDILAQSGAVFVKIFVYNACCYTNKQTYDTFFWLFFLHIVFFFLYLFLFYLLHLLLSWMHLIFFFFLLLNSSLECYRQWICTLHNINDEVKEINKSQREKNGVLLVASVVNGGVVHTGLKCNMRY